MPHLVDRKVTSEEADAMASPYIVSMNALFKDLEVSMMARVEQMIESGATEQQIIQEIEKMLS